MRRSSLLIVCLTLALSATMSRAETPPDPMTLTDMDGAELDIDGLLAEGLNVVLVFWQTWCGPCKREAPHLAEAARAHTESLRFVGVVSGSDRDVDETKVRKYVEKYALPYPQVRDRDLALVSRYEVKGTPTILILGPGREILYRGSTPPEKWATFARAHAKAG
jgi:thiol-disulfide isomerase/thioredoxin